MQQDPQVVLVTGASSGIGHAIALALARDDLAPPAPAARQAEFGSPG